MNQAGGGYVNLFCSGRGAGVNVDAKADVNMKEGKKGGGEGLLAPRV